MPPAAIIDYYLTASTRSQVEWIAGTTPYNGTLFLYDSIKVMEFPPRSGDILHALTCCRTPLADSGRPAAALSGVCRCVSLAQLFCAAPGVDLPPPVRQARRGSAMLDGCAAHLRLHQRHIAARVGAGTPIPVAPPPEQVEHRYVGPLEYNAPRKVCRDTAGRCRQSRNLAPLSALRAGRRCGSSRLNSRQAMPIPPAFVGTRFDPWSRFTC